MEENNTSQNNQDLEVIKVSTPNFFNRHFLHILIIFGIGFLVFTFLFQVYIRPIYIEGQSMQPTINKSGGNDLVYYKPTNSIKNGDIVIISAEKYVNEENIIKRVIASAGDTLTFQLTKTESYPTTEFGYYNQFLHYTIKLNGKDLSESYIKEQDCYVTIKTDAFGQYAGEELFGFSKNFLDNLKNVGDTYSITLKNNQVFVMGDNRNHSTDSRYFGPVNFADVLGKVVVHVPSGGNIFVALWQAIFSKN